MIQHSQAFEPDQKWKEDRGGDLNFINVSKDNVSVSHDTSEIGTTIHSQDPPSQLLMHLMNKQISISITSKETE